MRKREEGVGWLLTGEKSPFADARGTDEYNAGSLRQQISVDCTAIHPYKILRGGFDYVLFFIFLFSSLFITRSSTNNYKTPHNFIFLLLVTSYVPFGSQNS